MHRKNQRLRYTLTYFPVRGECDPLRILLAESGANYNYREVEGNSYVKFKDEMCLGDVPVLEDHEEGLKLSGREVIFRYLARCSGLSGDGNNERARVDMMSDQCFQLERKLWNIDKKEVPSFIGELQSFLEFLTSLLENCKTPFLVGNKVCIYSRNKELMKKLYTFIKITQKVYMCRRGSLFSHGNNRQRKSKEEPPRRRTAQPSDLCPSLFLQRVHFQEEGHLLDDGER